MVDFTTVLNDTEILINQVEKRNYVFVRDRPAIQHLVYTDYKYRKAFSKSNEKIHCPFAVAANPVLKRMRGFGFPKTTPWNILFDPQ